MNENVREDLVNHVTRSIDPHPAYVVASALKKSTNHGDLPRCYPKTRQNLQESIINWAISDYATHRKKILWLTGPAEIGKSTVSQSIREYFEEHGRLGAAYFFPTQSRLGSDIVILSLAYQLAIRNPDYRHIVLRHLAAHPSVLWEHHDIQLHHLIIHPFKTLMARHECFAQTPLLIILDGLNEYHSYTELIWTICEHVHEDHDSPFLWMLCTRSTHEPIGNSFLERGEICTKKVITMDDQEARSDALCVLKAGFQTIREDFPDIVSQNWPTRSDKDRIMNVTHGHLGLTSSILELIRNNILGNSSGPNPLVTLNRLYCEIFTTIPQERRSLSDHIIGLSLLYPSTGLTAYLHGRFFGIDQSTFYKSLLPLHVLIFVPPPTQAQELPLHIYHRYSLSKFLTSPRALDSAALHCQVAIQSFKWMAHQHLNSQPNTRTLLQDGDLTLHEFSQNLYLRVCSHIPHNSLNPLMEILESFDFTSTYFLGDKKTEIGYDCAEFIKWLYLLGPERNHELCIKLPWYSRVNRILNYSTPDPIQFASAFTTTKAVKNKRFYDIHLQLGGGPKSIKFILHVLPEIFPAPVY